MRFFTLEQANSLLPEVEKLLRELIFYKSEQEETEAAVKDIRRAVAVSGGFRMNERGILDLRGRQGAAAMGLKTAFDRIQEIGVQIKDLEIGLIDFPTVYRGEEVLLCWRLGESDIKFWHTLNDGFRGWKAIDDDFLANHEGDPQH